MEYKEMTIEILKLIISLVTPIIIIVFGLIINKKIERSKIGILKEKEWQVRWAELFLNHAIEFNKSISSIICSLFRLQDATKDSEIEKQIINQLRENLIIIQNIDWDIQNFAQFAFESNKEIIEKQKKLFDKIKELIKNKKGNLEEVRQIQFEYNQAVRKAHNEILKTF